MEVKEWIKNLTEEHEEFKKEMHESDVSYVYKNYEKIMLYETVFSYLIATEDDNFIGIRISDVYDYYINNDIYDIALTDDDQLLKLLGCAFSDKERQLFYKKYEDEFEEFRQKMISMPQEEIFFEYEKIRFYDIINLYIQNGEYCEVKKYMKDRSIAEIYQKFKESKCNFILSNTNGIKTFLNEVY